MFFITNFQEIKDKVNLVETKVCCLESQVDHLESNLASIADNINRMSENMKHMNASIMNYASTVDTIKDSMNVVLERSIPETNIGDIELKRKTIEKRVMGKVGGKSIKLEKVSGDLDCPIQIGLERKEIDAHLGTPSAVSITHPSSDCSAQQKKKVYIISYF